MFEGEVTLVDRVPAWREDHGRDLPLQAPDKTPGPVSLRGARADDTELEVPALPDLCAGSEGEPWQRPEDTFVDAAESRDTLPQVTTEDVEPTLLDTPTLLVSAPLTPTKKPADPARATDDGETATETKGLPPAPRSEPEPARPTIQVPPLRPRSMAPAARRSEREALARVIALAKPRVTPPRPRPNLRPLRTAEG